MRRGIRLFMLGAAAGAAMMALIDPRQGRRRRALMRDKITHLQRVAPRRLRRIERSMEGRARGLAHNLVDTGQGQSQADLERTVVERVESELGHEPELPLGALNFNAADGLVYVRGTVADQATARRIVERAAAVQGVRGVISLMHTPDGAPAGGAAGDPDLYGGVPRGAVHAEAVRRALIDAFPGLTDADILASDGYVHVLTALIVERTGRSADDVRRALDAMVLAVV